MAEHEEIMNIKDTRDFWLSMLDIDVMRSKEISFFAKGVYSILVTFADTKSRSWRLRVKTLTEVAGISERQVRYALKELREKGVIAVKENRANGHQTASTYKLIGHKAEMFNKDTSMQDMQAESPACTSCSLQTAPPADHLYDNQSLLESNNPPIVPQGDENVPPAEGQEHFDLKGEPAKTEKPKAKAEKAKNPNPLDSWFEDQFWKNYPRHVDKKRAREAFMRVLSKAKNPEEQRQWVIYMGIRLARYIHDVRDTEEKYIKHPSTWLNANDFSAPPEEDEVLRREVFS